jgi:quercetin dioxygenase-like cupin family protein
MVNFRKISEAIQFATDKMKKNGLFETERFFCDLYCFEPGQSQSAHTHEGSDKIYYVVQGRGSFQIGNEERDLAEGEIALAPSGQKHGVTNNGPGRLVLLVFMAPKPSH